MVAACGTDGPAGLLGLSATHLCADPPTMLVSIDKHTSALKTILEAGHFSINYLPDDAAVWLRYLPERPASRETDRFAKAFLGPNLLQVLPYYKALSALLIVSSWIQWNATMSLSLLEELSGHAIPVSEAFPLVQFRGGFIRCFKP